MTMPIDSLHINSLVQRTIPRCFEQCRLTLLSRDETWSIEAGKAGLPSSQGRKGYMLPRTMLICPEMG